jgi:hypothetical protein
MDQLPSPALDWNAEYNFYRKIILDEVERLRWNDGLEPIDVDLYEVKKTRLSDPDLIGTCRLGHQNFVAIAFKTFDSKGKKILRLQLRAQPQ